MTGCEPGVCVFLRQKTAPEDRFHAEDIEVIAGRDVTPDALVHAVVAEARGNMR